MRIIGRYGDKSVVTIFTTFLPSYLPEKPIDFSF